VSAIDLQAVEASPTTVSADSVLRIE
jgi:hypothetical protein